MFHEAFKGYRTPQTPFCIPDFSQGDELTNPTSDWLPEVARPYNLRVSAELSAVFFKTAEPVMEYVSVTGDHRLVAMWYNAAGDDVVTGMYGKATSVASSNLEEVKTRLAILQEESVLSRAAELPAVVLPVGLAGLSGFKAMTQKQRKAAAALIA